MKLSELIVFERRCDASGGIALSSNHWVGANDEENILRLYSTDGGQPLNDTLLDLDTFLEISGPDDEREADIESAATLGDLVFWIGSHSQSRKGKKRPNRLRFFATQKIISGDGTPSLKTFGTPCRTLRNKLVEDARLKDLDLANAITLPPKEVGGFNIESICAGLDDTQLWIGLRNPFTPAGSAALIPLNNPREVVKSGAEPELGDPVFLDLEGLGFRDMVRTGAGYLILAGDFRDRNAEGAKPSQLFAWEGPGSIPRRIEVDLGDLNPEALIVFPDQKILIVSDDGTRPTSGGLSCKESPMEDRTFRAAFLQGTLPFSTEV